MDNLQFRIERGFESHHGAIHAETDGSHTGLLVLAAWRSRLNIALGASVRGICWTMESVVGSGYQGTTVYADPERPLHLVPWSRSPLLEATRSSPSSPLLLSQHSH